jgi:hypothetical protein
MKIKKNQHPSSSNQAAGRSIEEVILRSRLEDGNTGLLSKPDTAATTTEFSKTVSLPVLKGTSTTDYHANLDSRLMSRQHRTGRDEEKGKYSEEDVRKMMEEVMKYCRSLQTRCQDLEVQLIQVSKNKSIKQPGSAGDFYQMEGDYPLRASTVRFASTPQGESFDTYDSMRSSAVNSSSGRIRPLSSERGGRNNLLSSSFQLPSSSSHQHLTGGGMLGGRPITAIANEMVLDIDHKVSYLKEIFKKTDPIEARRLAIIKIQSLIRGFLARIRRFSYQSAMREWRWIRCRPVIWLLDILLSNQSKLDSGFHLLTMNRTMRTLFTIFGKWSIVCRQNAPLRYHIKTMAEEKIAAKRLSFMKCYFDGFKGVTVGRISLKNANKERKEFIDKIRKDLSNYLREKGLIGIVPPHEVTKMLHRRVIDEFKHRKRVIIMKGVLNRFHKIVNRTKQFQINAKSFHFRKLVGKCFFAWSDHIYLVSLGLDRKRWPGPRKYEIRYNQKRIDNFARIRCEKLIFSAWKAYFSIQLTVKRKYQNKLSSFISGIFHAWKGVSSHYRKLRISVYENWSGYGRLMVQKPFLAWSDHVRAMRNRYNEHLRIAKSYARWKGRQRMLTIIKVWRHQALFGRIDGLYTRQMLLKTVADQKIFVTSLEKTMADQTMELEECKQMVLAEIDKKSHLESDIQRLTNENNKLKMSNHNYEQELKRLESVIQSMMLINPKQMEHLKKMQPDFKFKERNIAVPEAAPAVIGGGENAGGTSGDLPPKPASSAAAGGKGGNEEGQASETASVSSVNKIGALISDDGSAVGEKGGIAGDKSKISMNDSITSLDSGGLLNENSLSTAGGKGQGSLIIDTNNSRSLTPVKGIATDGDLLSPTGADTQADINPFATYMNDPKVSIEEQRLLERTHWLIERYKYAWPTPAEEAAAAAAENPSVNENQNVKEENDGEGDDNPAVPPSASGDDIIDNTLSISKDSIASNGGRFGKSFGGRSPTKRNSLLRGSNPFLKISTSRSMASPSRDPSMNVPGMSFRASFSRNAITQAIADAVKAVEGSGTGGAPMSDIRPDDYYADTELEEIVIVWAKMLFTILEFLETGRFSTFSFLSFVLIDDISLLPLYLTHIDR